jgi:hypothetical protein
VEWALLNRVYWVNGLLENIGGVEFVEWLCYWNEIVEWGLLNGVCLVNGLLEILSRSKDVEWIA